METYKSKTMIVFFISYKFSGFKVDVYLDIVLFVIVFHSLLITFFNRFPCHLSTVLLLPVLYYRVLTFYT